MKLCYSLFLLVFCTNTYSQSYKVYGKIINIKQEPLAFATVELKNSKIGTLSKEDGTYDLQLDEGSYELAITLLGYKPQIVKLIMRKANYLQNIILEEAEAGSLDNVLVKGKHTDKSEEYIRNVIRNKKNIENAAGDYSCKVYIKALQLDSSILKKPKKPIPDSILKKTALFTEMNKMALAEVLLNLHRSGNKIKEERTGVTKRGNTQNLFYLSVTEADFNVYNNLISIPSVSVTPFISPISYSGLLAYKFKTLKIEMVNGKKVYTIAVKPRQLSNATVEGEIKIIDSLWVIDYLELSLPKYHMVEYDYFKVAQQFSFVNNKAWMITKQQLIYNAASGKKKLSGNTSVTFENFELNKQFESKYFGTEISIATAEAYKRDSSFWQANRTIPLTEKEVLFIKYKDNIYQVVNSKLYLDSLDNKSNKITLTKLFFKGLNFNNHTKKKNWGVSSLIALYQPIQFGGTRIAAFGHYSKTFVNRKNIWFNSNLSYGINNKDLNGYIGISRMYNPFNRGYYNINLQKDFQFIYSGDAWINMLNRNNLFLNKGLGLGHGIELKNGLFLNTDFNIAFRRSLSGYKTVNKNDSTILGIDIPNNQPIAFSPYNALYGNIRLSYTPQQRYIREPKEKIILGSKWPTFYTLWKKGIPNIFNSKVNFDYLEHGLQQTIKFGTAGISNYTAKTGTFLNKKDLRLIDYKRLRRGDPIFFSNPAEAFQSLDSTFPVFGRFYEGHYVHEFNGALLNKIPLFKKLQLREIAGAGFLIVPERNNLKYVEIFTGIERVFNFPFSQLGKFKLGGYVSFSAANNFKNPVQFKIGITSWDKRNNKWF